MKLKLLVAIFIILCSSLVFAGVNPRLLDTIKQLDRMVTSFYPIIHRAEIEQYRQARVKFPAGKLRIQLSEIKKLLLHFQSHLNRIPTIKNS